MPRNPRELKSKASWAQTIQIEHIPHVVNLCLPIMTYPPPIQGTPYTAYTKHCRDPKFGTNAPLGYNFIIIRAIFLNFHFLAESSMVEKLSFHHLNPKSVFLHISVYKLKVCSDSYKIILMGSISCKFQTFTIFSACCRGGAMLGGALLGGIII